MLVRTAEVTMVFHYMGKSIHQKQSVLCEFKENYIYNQACSLLIANHSTNIVFKLLTVSKSDHAICVI